MSIATVTAVPFLLTAILTVVMQTISISAPRRRKPLVILDSLAIGAQYSTSISDRLAGALAAARRWTRSNCTPRRIFSALFSAKVSAAVAVTVLAAMWWHNLTVDSAPEAQAAVGLDCLLAMPWAIVWAVRATRMPMPEEGGAL